MNKAYFLISSNLFFIIKHNTNTLNIIQRPPKHMAGHRLRTSSTEENIFHSKNTEQNHNIKTADKSSEKLAKAGNSSYKTKLHS
jgi:hypothetical protein